MSEQTSTVFGTTAATPQGTNGGSATEDPVTLLVGEGKKFKTVQDLAKGKIESDGFIEQLKTENKALREAVASGADTSGIQAKIEQLLAAQKGSGQTSTPASNQSQSEPLTAEKVLDLLDRREQAKALANNASHFNSTINKVLGDKAGDIVMQRLNDLGLDKQTFDEIVSRNPQSALKLVGVKEAPAGGQGDVAGKSTNVNTAAAFSPQHNGDQVMNHSYFEKLRKEQGSKFFSVETQKQMFDARKRLGPDYFK